MADCADIDLEADNCGSVLFGIKSNSFCQYEKEVRDRTRERLRGVMLASLTGTHLP